MNKKVKEISICIGIAILTIAISLSVGYGIKYLYNHSTEVLTYIMIGFLVCVLIAATAVTVYDIRNTRD